MPTPMLHRHPNNFENSIVSATNKKQYIFTYVTNISMQCYGYVFAYHNHTQNRCLFLSLSPSLSLSLLLSNAHLLNENSRPETFN